ncbi:MAG: hypothetical protein SH856_10835 [Flavobacteriales bacterium]|nr:hypothetical protein [Flavobacteriales bacterium]
MVVIRTILITIFNFQFSIFNSSLGQTEDQKNSIIEQRIEAIAGALEEDAELDYTNLLEDLTYYYEHPLNLNNATADELRELYMLTDVQIASLHRHVDRYGSLVSIYELQAVANFDLQIIRLIEPFVTALPGSALEDFSFRNFFKEGRSDLFLRYKRVLEKQGGYQSNVESNEAPDFLASADYLYTRYRFQYRRNITIGFTAEKDAGEKLNRQPDFFSGHIFYRDKTFLRALVVGDYNAQFGQGLTFWNGLGFGKSAYVTNLKKNAMQLRPYSSVDENLFLRGSAATLGWKKMELTAFFSSKKIDANLEAVEDSTLSDDEFSATSLQTSGLHRTESELADKHAMGETIVGGNLRYNSRKFSLGITAVRTSYSEAIQPGTQLYQQFRFSGKEILNTGLDYHWVLRNANFFGEVSRSDNGGMASLNGVVAALHPRLSVAAIHRWFEKDYQAQHVNVFGEQSENAQNESGIYFGAEAKLASAWTLSLYADQVTFPWLKFRTDAPSQFTDYFSQLNFRPDRKHEFYVRYRLRNGAQNISSLAEVPIDYPVDITQHNFRIHSAYSVHPNVQLKSRMEWSVFEKPGEEQKNGFLLYQDVVWKKLDVPVSVQLRYALFDSPSWDTRIYAYESDILYAFSIPAYYGKGSRFYTMLKWDVMHGVDFWLRYSQWLYTDRDVISSGTSEIQGNRKSEIHAQVRWQF